MISPYVFPGIEKTSRKQIAYNVSLEKVNEIISTVCVELELFKSDLVSKSRKRPFVEGRQICHYLIMKHTKMSLNNTGKIFGGRDHSTVIYSVNTVNDLMDTNPKYKALVYKIESLLRFKN